MATESEWATHTGASRWCLLTLAVIFLLVMHTVLPNSGGSGADLPQALLVWTAMLLMIVGCAWHLRYQPLQLTPFCRMIVLATALLTLPLCWSPVVDWRLDALPRLAGLWAGTLLFILLLNCRFTDAQKRGILYLIAVAAVMQSVYSLAGLWCPSLLPESGRSVLQLAPGAVGVFQQRNVTASFLATGAAVLLWLFADPRFTRPSPGQEKVRRTLISAAIVLLFMLLTVIKSRTGWLGGALIWLLFSVMFTRAAADIPHKIRWGVALLPVVGVALGVAVLEGDLLVAWQEHDGSNTDRIFMLQYTWQMILQHPFRGWGYGGFIWSFAHFSAQHAPADLLHQNEVTYPHNEILFWWVEGGLIALAGLLVMFVGGCVVFFRRPARSKLALLCCLLPILLHTQLEYPLYQSPVHWLLLLIFLSFADPLSETAHATRRVFRRRSLRILPCLIAMLACCGALLTADTFWQGRYLTAFIQTPQRYASTVLGLHETGIGTERLRKEQALSWILRYQASGNIEDLEQFNTIASRWLKTWTDPDIYHNLINVQKFLGHTRTANQLLHEAHLLYPEDPRFLPDGPES